MGTGIELEQARQEREQEMATEDIRDENIDSIMDFATSNAKSAFGRFLHRAIPDLLQ